MASATDVERLKALAPSAALERFADDDAISAFIEEHGGDVRRAAGLLWEERRATTARFVDISEGSSRRAMQQEFENASKMVEFYLGDEADSTLRKGARVHKIERS